MKDKYSIHYDCSCQGCVARLTAWSDEPLVYLSILKLGKYSFWNRFRHAWKSLVTGDPYEDQVVLDLEQVQKLAEDLQDIKYEINKNIDN
ncbi:MAG: hypothetical protein H8E55_18880 [Pelagibacterales bacterium]|nr:hypothetical protein [Pelagibacterales bacterium]